MRAFQLPLTDATLAAYCYRPVRRGGCAWFTVCADVTGDNCIPLLKKGSWLCAMGIRRTDGIPSKKFRSALLGMA